MRRRGKGELKGSELALPVSFSFKIPTPAQGGNRPASVKAKSQLRLQGAEYCGYNGYKRVQGGHTERIQRVPSTG